MFNVPLAPHPPNTQKCRFDSQKEHHKLKVEELAGYEDTLSQTKMRKAQGLKLFSILNITLLQNFI